MRMKRYKPDQVVNLLRQIEVEIADGKTAPQACKEAGALSKRTTAGGGRIRGLIHHSLMLSQSSVAAIGEVPSRTLF